MRNLAIEKLPEFDNHELVSHFYDKRTGLRGFIAIHNTRLGPATGGTRYWTYRSEVEALRDVLNLSKAMTYKCALAGVPYGGGKGVIMKNARHPKDLMLLSAYARIINLFNGNFYTGEDVGITESDVAALAKGSKFVNGIPTISGDPAPWAALGVFYAISAGLEAIFGKATIRGWTFAIKGLGKVGSELSRLIIERGGKIFAADISKAAIRKTLRRFSQIKIVNPVEIHKLKVDVFAPCALGGDFNSKTIHELKCKIVCGGANNQLASSADGERLHRQGILYIPDYVANAGGLINVTEEWNRQGYSPERVKIKVAAIKKTVKRIVQISLRHNKATSEVADDLAEKIFNRKNHK